MVYIEGTSDIEKTFADFANSKDSFDVWRRDQVKEITGVGPGVLPSGPMPENLMLYGY